MLQKYKVLLSVLAVLGMLGLVALWQYRGSHASVSLHGVNYSDREFSYFIADPENPEKATGGEHIAPFAAGGTTCCAVLPLKWKPGAKIRLSTTHWLKKLPDGTLPEVVQEHEVEVPEYAEAGELWVIRDEDGKVNVVSSNLQPDHPNWPGKIKGWPVPSIEYQRERWELYRKDRQGYVELYTSMLKELESHPQDRAKSAWNHAKERNPAELQQFTGPDDPRFLQKLQKEYSDGLAWSSARLTEILEAKP
ncbi:DUF3304 domain-containing protein [Massilia sp. IC2-477]|uniref:DUF3304 domain-containing protein n=1 Tax=Massilia sp. IC2-477 TaxID=2887198 RepID=UPI001D10DDFF|nr:DUF3304 domain-containing protein [Massilia sp. IC2-477]MCC2955838.1 DUF3304 domain-containing protein [Massilia sp. IC2-477]